MILVTGGAGYIGSHAVRALKRAGFDPLIFDNFSTGHRRFTMDIPVIEGDLVSPGDVERAFAATPIEGVLHFAGLALVGESRLRPDLYYQVNVGGGVNLLAAMHRHGVKRFVFSSTCATYGVPETTPIHEDLPKQPVNSYGETKLAFERAMRWFRESHGLEYLSLRYFNAAGADPAGGIGEDHANETHLIPLILDAALGRRQDVTILGTDYPTPDGTCIRDYIHVNDLADAHVDALRALFKGVESQALNLGTGRGHSVREVIETARRITGRDFSVRETERRPGDPPVLVADPRRAKDILGWTARLGLEEIVKTAWAWHQGLKHD
ncbi:MAG TPA: UDP-glucose 4-epimerase GalE [Terriglobia bacterium]|nr:UDP-glucose 4-epimerase GalE [Terriglobia bacterium]